MMNANPTESPTVLETVLPWAAWGIGLLVLAAAWWGISRLRRSGRVAVAMESAKRLLVKRTAPQASPSVPPEAPSETAADPSAPIPDTFNRPPRTRIIVAAASVPSVLSLIWVASTVAEITGGPSGWAAGVFADVLIVSTVAVAWFNPEVRRLAGTGGWVAAIAAGTLLGWHHWGTEEVFFSLVPVGSKFLWHVALAARTAWEARVARTEAERAAREEQEEAQKEEAARAAAEEKARQDAELSTDPTHEQQVTVAEKRRLAKHERQLADADVDLADAQAERDHRLKLAEIRRQAAQTREMDREDAETVKQRIELVREINASRPASFALPPGEVPSDLSGLPVPAGVSGGASVMGFGAVMGADLGVSRGRPVGDAPVNDPQLRELMAYIADAGPEASVRGAARELRVTPPTIRRWRDKAQEQGLDVSALKPTK